MSNYRLKTNTYKYTDLLLSHLILGVNNGQKVS